MPSMTTVRALIMGTFAALALGACASTDLGGAAATGPAAEAERLRLVDRCMVASGQATSAKDATSARCQCTARGVLSGVSEGEAGAACARNPGAFTETRRSARPKAQ
jgi:hypothetical protein